MSVLAGGINSSNRVADIGNVLGSGTAATTNEHGANFYDLAGALSEVLGPCCVGKLAIHVFRQTSICFCGQRNVNYGSHAFHHLGQHFWADAAVAPEGNNIHVLQSTRNLFRSVPGRSHAFLGERHFGDDGQI